MKYIYYIIFFVGIATLAIAGVVWYLRRDATGTQFYNPFSSGSQSVEAQLYDPPSNFQAPGLTTTTVIEATQTELVPQALPPGLIQ